MTNYRQPLLKMMLLLLVFCSAAAQSFRTAQVTGKAVDDTGAFLPHVHSAAINVATLEYYKADIDANGEFSFNELPAGRYEFFVSANTQCTEAKSQRVRIEAGQSKRLVFTISFAHCKFVE